MPAWTRCASSQVVPISAPFRSRLGGCRSRLSFLSAALVRRRRGLDVVDDALRAALAAADGAVAGCQVLRNDLQRRVTDARIGKTLLDRFQDVCARLRRAAASFRTTT